jgi:hypothetical protein
MKDDATLICIENATENAALTNGRKTTQSAAGCPEVFGSLRCSFRSAQLIGNGGILLKA